MTYAVLSGNVIVFDHLEKTERPKKWKRVEAVTRVFVDNHVSTWHKVEFSVISGPAKGYRGEDWAPYLVPLSALEMLAEAAE